ncbi:hypothetical protein GGR27_002323 [Lewinella antarctica]|uniref:Fibronectin type-III domain-containing protein n=2 Tax=Neolewinella antarctica TaxID=442734 RepID=A0ABX0XC26_9BACT|nr:hypothetical protein [Neolewinella antarctica]
MHVLFMGMAAATGLLAQVTLTPSGSTGSAYPTISAAGVGIEGPDNSSSACADNPDTDAGNHKDFGPHILQTFAADLGPAGTDVFEFYSHIDEDSDRCLRNGNNEIDRVRVEIKGGPEGQSDPVLEHTFGETSYYRWQFKLDAGFVGTGSFTHLFQNKAEGGNETSLPILTLTARTNDMELVYNANNVSGEDMKIVDDVPLSNFRGKWVEVYLMQVHSNTGSLELTITDVASGVNIVNFSRSNIDLWREVSTTDPTLINRPKWGIYRSKRLSGTVPNRMRDASLRDEVVQFASFCSSETPEGLCPSIVVEAPNEEAPGAVENTLPVNGSQNVPATMPVTWSAVEGATSYEVGFSASLSQVNSNVTTVTDSFFYPTTLNEATTYYYRVTAVNDAGAGPRGATKQFTTLASFDDGNWEVARGHARPNVESNADNGGFYEDQSNDEATVNRVVSVDGQGNNAYQYRSGPSTDGDNNYRWRYRQSADEEVTVVLRVAPVSGENNITFVEFRGLGWRQKVRINRNSLKFETAASDPEVDFPTDFFAGEEFQTIRLNFANGDGGTPMVTTVYLNEATAVFASAASDGATGSRYVDIGRSSSAEYAATYDFIAVDPTGAFAPSEGTALPSDLEGAAFPLVWSTPLTVRPTTKGRLLEWAVSNQVSSDFFTVETSRDGSNYLELDKIAADGNLAGERKLTYEDFSFAEGTTYYRVRQTDYDGRFSFSNTVAIGERNARTIKVFPNPTADVLQVRGLSGTQADYRIMSLTGRELSSGRISENSTDLEVGDLARGAYFLQIITAGGEVETRRFVRQ